MSEPRNWMVWSNEHHAWWRPNSAGYCLDPIEAGRYTKAEADDICANARSHVEGEPPPEVAYHEDEACYNNTRAAEARDAARYRAIRSIATPHMIRILQDWAADPLAPHRELDEAVDHAIAMEAERARMEAGHA